MTDQKQAPERIWLEPACAGGERCWSSVRLDDCPEEGCGLSASEYARLDLLEAAEKRIADLEENMRIGNESWSRLCEARSNALTKAEAERDQSIRREQALKSSYDEERKALVENIRLRVRIKEMEAERDQALASVGAVIEKAKQMALSKYENAVEWASHHGSKFDGQTHSLRIAQEIEALNTDATDALNEMLADAWDEGRLSSALDRNPYRKEESNG